MMTKLIFWYLGRKYKKLNGLPILYIKGTGSDYPKYLLYTENEKVSERMDRF